MKKFSSEKKSSSIHRLIPRSKLFTKGFPAQTNSQLQSFFYFKFKKIPFFLGTLALLLELLEALILSAMF
jgi:hypothetical protein